VRTGGFAVNDKPCLLTIGDFSTLEALHEQWAERDHELTPALWAKLESASIVFPDDLPRDVASLGSRIQYAVGDQVHVSVLTGASGLSDDCLPISLPVGLALLGREEGWALNFETGSGRYRMLTLGRVIEQPETTWPGRFSPKKAPAAPSPLRLVAGSRPGSLRASVAPQPDDDDPGPAAA
jgi:regulator of nucleoside diphosphate kinase